MPQPIDPELLRHLQDAANATRQPPAQDDAAAQFYRQASEAGARRLPALEPEGIQRQDLYVTLPGRELPIRLYQPAGANAHARPVLMPYFHGGGWMVGSIATHDALCAHLAHFTGAVVASVHYRRTPENPHPAGHEDCWEAIRWLVAQAPQLGLPRDSAIVLGGDSAGAHLALGCAIRAIEQGLPSAAALLLFYPPTTPQACNTASWRQHEHGPGLTGAAMQRYWRALSGDAASNGGEPVLYPRHFAALGALPPTVLMTAAHDILCDDGNAFAAMLRQANVPVAHSCAADMPHGFARMLTASDAARQHVRRACEQLLALL